jgi:hypothetical protein
VIFPQSTTPFVPLGVPAERPMIILDTDHISLLQHADSAEGQGPNKQRHPALSQPARLSSRAGTARRGLDFPITQKTGGVPVLIPFRFPLEWMA